MSHRDDHVFSHLNFRSERYFWGKVFAFFAMFTCLTSFLGLFDVMMPQSWLNIRNTRVIIDAIAKSTFKQDNSIKTAY